MMNRCALFYLEKDNADFPDGIVVHVLFPYRHEIQPWGFDWSPGIFTHIEDWLYTLPYVCSRVRNYELLEKELARRIEVHERLYEITKITRASLYSSRKVS